MRYIVILLLFFLLQNKAFLQDLSNESNFECLLETSVSGLFQNKRKFLKDTEFFPHKTIMNFSNEFSILIEKENTRAKETEVKYKFKCLKEKKNMIISCKPFEDGSSYNINFSLSTMRYRKILITDYWINGKGSEVDFVHIAHGYCYSID